MAQTYAGGIHLVLVTTDDRERQLWVAAAPREEAVTLVLDAVPEGWNVVRLPPERQSDQHEIHFGT
jgi:hypothetical protein